MVFVESTDGGASFTQPAVAFDFLPWQPVDRKLSGRSTGLCGDGPEACVSGYVFGRVLDAPRIAADPVAGDGNDAYVVVGASVPGSQVPTKTTCGSLPPSERRFSPTGSFAYRTRGCITSSSTTVRRVRQKRLSAKIRSPL